MKYAIRWLALLLFAGAVALPAWAENPCKVEVVRGSATMLTRHGVQPVSLRTSSDDKTTEPRLKVTFDGLNISGTVEGGSPPYKFHLHYVRILKDGTSTTVDKDYVSQYPSFGGAIGAGYKEPISVTVMDGRGRAGVTGSQPFQDETYRMFIGDKITTGPDTRVKLIFPDGSVFMIKSNSIVTLQNEAVLIDAGGMSFQMEKMGSKFQVVTPSTCIGDLGTKYYVETDRQGTSVYVTQGKVWMKDRASKGRVVVDVGQMSHCSPGGIPSAPMAYISGEPEKRFNTESTLAAPSTSTSQETKPVKTSMQPDAGSSFIAVLVVAESDRQGPSNDIIKLIRKSYSSKELPIHLYYFNKAAQRQYCETELSIHQSDLPFVGLAEHQEAEHQKVLVKRVLYREPRSKLDGLMDRLKVHLHKLYPQRF